MPLSPEASVGRVLSALGTSSDALLGAGGQASVYALGDDRVVRVLRPGGDAEAIRRRQELVDSLGRDRVPFALPDVLEVREIERRLPGRSVLDELRHRDGKGRARVIEAHLVAAARLGDLHVHAREWFGDLIAEDAVRAASWREYLSERVARNLTRGPSELRSIDPAAIADDMPDIGEA